MVIMTRLLASTMWMVSDRQEFWNSDALSDTTQMGFVHSDGTIDTNRPEVAHLKGKKVLLLIHGYNNSKEDVLPAYFSIKQQIDRSFVDAKGNIYDAVIGYVWPGFDSPLEYYQAKEHAREVAKRAAQLIAAMSSEAAQVDVMAHSMGNYLFLEAMKKTQASIEVVNFFSLAAAVDNESIEIGEVYDLSIENCKEAYIVYSNEDDVLKYLYTLAEFDRALGSSGIEDISKIPSNVQLVDCTDVVDAHSHYHKTTQVYTFIRDRLLGTPPLPEQAKQVKLLPNSEVVVLLPAEVILPD